MVVGNEAWLDNLEDAGAILAAAEAFRCGLGDAESCVTVALEVSGRTLDQAEAVVTGDAALIEDATARLADPARQAGVVQGSPPTCADAYQCTPGDYLPCYPDGARQCGSSCTWDPCATATGADGDAADAADTGPDDGTGAEEGGGVDVPVVDDPGVHDAGSCLASCMPACPSGCTPYAAPSCIKCDSCSVICVDAGGGYCGDPCCPLISPGSSC
jgi:hypothetical protein